MEAKKLTVLERARMYGRVGVNNAPGRERSEKKLGKAAVPKQTIISPKQNQKDSAVIENDKPQQPIVEKIQQPPVEIKKEKSLQRSLQEEENVSLHEPRILIPQDQPLRWL